MAVHDQDKVFAPTPRKRRQAREQGLVVISPDLIAGVLLLAFTGILHFYGDRLIDESGTYLRSSLEQVRMTGFESREELSSHIVGQIGSSAGYFLVRLWPLWTLPLVAIAAVLVQTRGLFHWSAVTPSLKRINPASGLQRFSFFEISRRFLVASLKVSGLAAVAWFWASRHHKLDAQLDLAHQSRAELDQAVTFLFLLSLGLLAWGVADYLFRRKRFEKQLRMTARELAEEQKQFDPHPQLGRRVREMRTHLTAAISLNRNTDLLITNGLAACTLLRFDPQTQSLPVIVDRQSESAGVQLLQRCLHARVTIHESAALQQELNLRSDQPIPERLWPELAELFSRQNPQQTGSTPTSEPDIKERVSS